MASNLLGLRSSYATATDPSVPPSLHSLPSLPTSHITFRHPGYSGPGNILCRLPAYDGPIPRSPEIAEDDARVWGLHHGTALEACKIIACNTDGFLSTTLLEAAAVPDPDWHWDLLLTGKVYFFYPRAWLGDRDQSTLVYPVCPSFQDWQFPHELVPDQWLSAYTSMQPVQRVPSPSQYSAAVLLRDGSCRVTNFDDCTETAHIIPKREHTWFTRNEMEVYNRNPKLSTSLITSDIENLLCLRTDIHMQVDAGNLVLVPKAGSSRIHFLSETRQYGPLFHNRTTEQLRVAAEFLYARFAWAVLPLAQAFAEKPGVKVRVWNEELEAWEDRAQQPDVPAPPRKKPRLETRGSKSAQTARGGNDSVPMECADAPSTPPGPAQNSSPSPTWTPGAGYDRRTKIFEGIVSRDPGAAWEKMYWHPDAERMEVLKDAYLTAHEPMHEIEMKRQVGILKRGCGLYDGEAVWEGSHAVQDDESE